MVNRARTRADARSSGRDVADVVYHDGGEAAQAGQLAQAGHRLPQHPVHARRPVGVGGHLRDDHHGVGHAGGV